MSTPNHNWTDLNDIDGRFEATDVNKDNLANQELRQQLLEAVKLMDPPVSAMDDMARKELNGPMAATMLRDKLTGNKVAVVAYDAVDKDSIKNNEVTTKYQMFDMKNEKPVLPLSDSNNEEAKRKLGIYPETNILPGNALVTIGDNAGKNAIHPSHIGQLLIEAQMQSRLSDEDEPALDDRIHLIKHVVFDKKSDAFFERRIEDIEQNERKMARSKEVLADQKNYSPEQQQEAFEDSQYLKHELMSQRAEAHDLIHNPQKLAIDQQGKMAISDGVDLSNRFAQLRGNDTTQLGDVRQGYKVGKLSPEDIAKSNIIQKNDTVLNATRIVDNTGISEYHIYAIEKDGDENDDLAYAITDRANKEGWVRAEKFEGGILVAVNSHALKSLGIYDNQLNVGPNRSNAAKQAVTPEALRQAISETQHIDHRMQLMSNIATADGNPDADTYKEYKAADYTDSKRYDLSMDADQAMHNIDSAYVDSRFKVLPVPPNQIEQMERLGVIPRANDPKSEHYEYIGTPNVFVIKDSELGETRTFGQTLSHASAGYPGAVKSYDTSDFEVVTNGMDGRIKVASEPSIKPGVVVWDHQRIEGDDSIGDVLGEQLSVSRNGTKYYASNSHGLHSSAYTPRDIMESLVDATSESQNRAAPQLENNYGLGEKHETVEAYEALQQPEVTQEATVGIEPVQPSATARRRHN